MQPRFTDVLESVEGLPADEKEMLVDIVRSRLVEKRREELRYEIDAARREFENGDIKPMTADQVMDEVLK